MIAQAAAQLAEKSEDCDGWSGPGASCRGDGFLDKLRRAGEFVADPVGSVAGSALDEFAQAVAEATAQAVKNLATFWTRVPNPQLGEQGTAAWLDSQMLWVTSAVAVLAVMIAGARMAWNARGGEDARELLRALLTLTLVSAGNVAIVNTALQAGDAYSVWILNQVGGADFANRLAQMTSISYAAPGTRGVALILGVVLGLVVMLGALFQLVLMIARSAVLIVLVGAWPLSAAATNTDWGRQWFKKITAWIVAFALYKPAAATIYAAGIRAFGSERGVIGVLTGTMLLLLAILALPAMIRLFVPMVGGLAGSSGSGAAGAGLAAAAGAAAASRPSGPTGASPVPMAGGAGASPPSWGGGASGGPGGGPGQSDPSGSPSSPTRRDQPTVGAVGGSSTGPRVPAGTAAAAPGGAAGGAPAAGAGAAAAAGPGAAVLVADAGARGAKQVTDSVIDGSTGEPRS